MEQSKKFISPGAWFSMTYPADWNEFEDGEGSFLFYNPNEWTGNFRISAFKGNATYGKDSVKQELRENSSAIPVRIGRMECAYSKEMFEEEELEQPEKNDSRSIFDDRREERRQPEERHNKVVNIHATAALKVVLVKPERFENASEIADHLREKRTVVMNLESTNKDVARRLIDFLSGVAYAGDGKIKKVAANTYIITP